VSLQLLSRAQPSLQPYLSNVAGTCLFDQDLLLLLQALSKVQGNIEDLSDDICGGKSEPLRERNVGDTIRLVDLNPDQVLVASVFDVMPS
jgi:hypothetical protein